MARRTHRRQVRDDERGHASVTGAHLAHVLVPRGRTARRGHGSLRAGQLRRIAISSRTHPLFFVSYQACTVTSAERDILLCAMNPAFLGLGLVRAGACGFVPLGCFAPFCFRARTSNSCRTWRSSMVGVEEVLRGAGDAVLAAWRGLWRVSLGDGGMRGLRPKSKPARAVRVAKGCADATKTCLRPVEISFHMGVLPPMHTIIMLDVKRKGVLFGWSADGHELYMSHIFVPDLWLDFSVLRGGKCTTPNCRSESYMVSILSDSQNDPPNISPDPEKGTSKSWPSPTHK